MKSCPDTHEATHSTMGEKNRPSNYELPRIEQPKSSHYNKKNDVLIDDVDQNTFSTQQQILIADRYKQDTDHRRNCVYWVLGVVSAWLLGVFALLCNHKTANLPEYVLITLLGTTTLNILGLPLIILKSLFPTPKEERKRAY